MTHGYEYTTVEYGLTAVPTAPEPFSLCADVTDGLQYVVHVTGESKVDCIDVENE